MKSMLLATLLLSVNSWADNVSCTNVDTESPQDTLEFVQEGSATYAYYFDGSGSYSMMCETTADDGYDCDGAFSVRMYGSGETTVTRGSGEEIEFNCF